MVKAFCRGIDAVNERVGKFIGLLVIPMAFLVVAEVVLRYAFNRPTTWIWETNLILLGFVSVLLAGYTLLYRGHIIVDIAVGHLSPRKRAIIDLITALLFFFAFGMLLWKAGVRGWESLLARETLPTVWSPPIYPIRIALAVGVFLLLLQGLAKFIRDLITAISPESGATS